MQPGYVAQRPLSRTVWTWHRIWRTRAYLRDGGLELARHIHHPTMKFVLEGRQAGFRSIEPLLGGARCCDAHLGQARRLLLKLLDGFFVNLANGIPLALDGGFKFLQ